MWVVFTSRRMYGSARQPHPALLQRPAWRRSRQEHHPRRSSGSRRSISARLRAATRAPLRSISPRRRSWRATRAASGCSIRARPTDNRVSRVTNAAMAIAKRTAMAARSSAPIRRPTTRLLGHVNDKCSSAAGCCDSTNLCINGFCAQAAPPPRLRQAARSRAFVSASARGDSGPRCSRRPRGHGTQARRCRPPPSFVRRSLDP